MVLLLFTVYSLILFGTKGWKGVLDKNSWHHCFSLRNLYPILACPPWHNLFPSIAMLGRNVCSLEVPLKAKCNSLTRETPSFGRSYKICIWWCWNVLLSSLSYKFPELGRPWELVFLVSLQSLTKLGLVVYFPSYNARQGPESSLLRVSHLGKRVDSRFSILWASFYSHYQKRLLV